MQNDMQWINAKEQEPDRLGQILVMIGDSIFVSSVIQKPYGYYISQEDSIFFMLGNVLPCISWNDGPTSYKERGEWCLPSHYQPVRAFLYIPEVPKGW